MKDYEVLVLVAGKWVFHEKITAPSRKFVSDKMTDRKPGTFKIRVLE